jgi:catechol 2,3-dioxygenase-like lactoylglutathione lyase family enzyme
MYADVTASAEHHKYHGIADWRTTRAGTVVASTFMGYSVPTWHSRRKFRLAHLEVAGTPAPVAESHRPAIATRGGRRAIAQGRSAREAQRMINGAHVLIYSTDPEADRAFFRDVLQLRSVDAGGGWLIFALPPAEVAVHPSDGEFSQRHAGHNLLGALTYLMCDDLRATMKWLEAKDVACTAVEEARWGIKTTIRLPSGGELGLYQPTHPTAIGLAGRSA